MDGRESVTQRFSAQELELFIHLYNQGSCSCCPPARPEGCVCGGGGAGTAILVAHQDVEVHGAKEDVSLT